MTHLRALKSSTIVRSLKKQPQELNKSTLGRPRVDFSWILMSFWDPFGRPWRPLGTLLSTIRLPLASFCHPLDPLGIPWCPGGAIWAFFGVALAHLYHLDTTLTPLSSVLKCIFEWFWAAGRIGLYLAVRLLFQKDWERA